MVAETEIGGPAGAFPGTRWTMILSAREGMDRRCSAMQELLAIYWKPLYYHARRKGLPIESAKDAVQGFCMHLLEQDFLSRLDPGKGRLRSYLRTSFDHFLMNEHEKNSAWKRGGKIAIVPLDFDAAEKAFRPETSFDREWAQGVMERAVARLRAEFDDGTRKGSFDIAMRFFGFTDAPSYADAAREAGMSVSQFKAFLHRTRERFRDLVRDQVADTVADGREAEAEVAELVKALKA